MPIYLLDEEPVFPSPQLADPEGLLAVGGDLSPERLINAYASGIFPWFSDGDPLLWWSPDPRMVLFPGDIHVSKSMAKILDKKLFSITFDKKFETVIANCRESRLNREGTWITQEMEEAYIKLHQLGICHSVEVWETGKTDKLAGGLYGVSLGRAFFGESMFFTVPNSSKVAFITLARTLFKNNFLMIDCQVPNPHLKSLGAHEIPRVQFLEILTKSLQFDTLIGKWELS